MLRLAKGAAVAGFRIENFENFDYKSARVSTPAGAMATQLAHIAPLRGGGKLPVVGLGVYKASPAETEAAVTSALKLGYRHVDTAQVRSSRALSRSCASLCSSAPRTCVSTQLCCPGVRERGGGGPRRCCF